MSGHLYIVGTPIGNLEDISLRALRIMKEVDMIACEDTRETSKLLRHYDIRVPLVSYHEFNERVRSVELIKKIKTGKNIALVSDAGMPGISDPGYQIITAAIQENLPVIPIPGPSAVLTALVVSGLSMHRFAFEGFLPEKSAARKKFLIFLKEEPRTMIFFESAQRLKHSLQDIFEILGDRSMAIAHELTKKFESVDRGFLKELLDTYGSKDVKGEFVLIVSGKSSSDEFKDLPIEEHVYQVMSIMNISRQEAIKLVANLRGLSKRKVYQVALKKQNSSFSE
jgi:16S rRNA (cytidine1402-2'-O)-methyltransferase